LNLRDPRRGGGSSKQRSGGHRHASRATKHRSRLEIVAPASIVLD
jgi:hypothetical protein